MKVCAQGSNVAEVDAPSGRRYRRDKGGIFDMAETDAKALIKGGGFAPSMSGTTSRRFGFRCPDCGFGSFFRVCKCGAECVREVPDAP